MGHRASHCLGQPSAWVEQAPCQLGKYPVCSKIFTNSLPEPGTVLVAVSGNQMLAKIPVLFL